MHLDVIEQKIASNGNAYLKNRADMVDGHYCIARKHKDGYHEYWNDKAKAWCSTASVFELGRQL